MTLCIHCILKSDLNTTHREINSTCLKKKKSLQSLPFYESMQAGYDGRTHEQKHFLVTICSIVYKSFNRLRALTNEKLGKICFNLWTQYLTTGSESYIT